MKPTLTSFVLTACLAAAISSPAGASQTKWRIDSHGSSLQFHVKNLGFNSDGKFTKLTGEVLYNDKDFPESSVQANIDTGSIDTGMGMRDKHLKSKDFFNVVKFPEAEFRSSKIEVLPSGNFKLIGTLSLHGVSKDVILESKPLTKKVDQSGHNHLLASASTSLQRKQFDIGGLAAASISDNVKIDLAIDMIQD